MSQHVHLILFASGSASRRGALTLLSSGRVAINGVSIREDSSDAAREITANLDAGDVITLDGHPVHPESRHRYILVNKPRGVICAADDSRGRQGKDGKRALVTSLVPPAFGVTERLGHAGRLDLESEGLVLLTNDRELMGRITQGNSCSKVYEVTVVGIPSDAILSALRDGADIPGIGKLLPCAIEVLDCVQPHRLHSSTADREMFEPSVERRSRTRLRVTLREGKNRQIRRMFGSYGHRVVRLVRTSIGTLALGTIPMGGARELSTEEVEELVKICA